MNLSKASFVLIATIFTLNSAGLAQAQDAGDSGRVIKVLSEVDIHEKVDGKDMRTTTVMVTFEPGASSPPHRHPGAVFGYVLEGEFEFKVEGGPVQRLSAGETFYEPTMILHEMSRNPNLQTSTQVLAVIVHPRDAKQLVIPGNPNN